MSVSSLGKLERNIMTDLRPWYRFKTIDSKNALSDQGHEFAHDMIHGKLPPVHDTKRIDVFNESWLDELSSLINNQYSGMTVFFRKPFYQHPTAHIDINTNVLRTTGKKIINPCAINFLYDFGDFDNEMIWYDVPDHSVTETEIDVKFSPADTAYWEFDVNELTEISRCSIGRDLVLVRTDLPHNVVMGKAPRLAFSLHFRWTGWRDPQWPSIIDQCKESIHLD
jgi:hypothetical protein